MENVKTSVRLDKLKELILYIASHTKNKHVGVTKLWKLIYFCDVFALREYGNLITNSEYIKYQHGPVPSRGEKALRQLKADNAITIRLRLHRGKKLHEIIPQRRANTSLFSQDEIVIIDKTCAELGNKSASALSSISHDEPAWLLADFMQKLNENFMFHGAKEDPEGL